MLTKKVVFINGACGLIGSQFVKACLAVNAKVIAADINQLHLDTLSQSCSSDDLLTLCIDLCSVEQVQSGLEASIEKFGELTALVNAAYPRNKHYGREFFDVEFDDFCENLNLNIGTTFLSSQIFSRYFKAQGRGSIVNIGSIYGMMAPDFDIYQDVNFTMPVEYAAIKSAIVHLTKYMAQMLKKNGVRVNCISPGGILDSQPKAFLERYNARSGQQGMLLAEQLNSTLLYLLSENSSAVTGQNIVVDDGFSL